jgi:L-asparaginase
MVDIAYSYAGAGRVAIDALVGAGCRGLVIAGLPPGSGAARQEAAIDDARKAGVVVVLSTRGTSGRVLERTRLRERAIVVGDNLSPQKARILTMLTLTVTDDPRRIQALFYEY